MTEPEAGTPPTGRWPFTGRAEQTERITAMLRAQYSRGVVLAGGAGVGRSRLAAEVARAFGPVRRVAGTRCGAALPFSAFAGLLQEAGPGDPVREVTTAFRTSTLNTSAVHTAALNTAGPVLVVDDAHLLDQASAALVHRLAVRRDVRLVVTVRDGEPAPDAVVALWKDDLLRRVEVPPLSQGDLARVLEGALGGHVEGRAVRRLAAITGGDLRMVRELVLAGTLSERAGTWGWGGGPAVSGCVRELLASRLGPLDADEWDALTYLALGAPHVPGTLARLVGPRTVERLEAKGLLTGSGDAPYAEVIRALCGPVRTARLSRNLAESVSTHVTTSMSAPVPVPGPMPAPVSSSIPAPTPAPMPTPAPTPTPGSAPTPTPGAAPAPASGAASASVFASVPGAGAASGAGADVVSAAVWRLDGGLAADPGLLTEACRAAIAADKVELAVRLGRAAVDANAGDEALATALARHAPRTPADVPRLRDEDERATAAILAGNLAVDPAGGLADGAADSGWDLAAAAYHGRLARLHRLRGRIRTALARARDGVWRLPEGRAAFAGMCLGELAHAAALLGDVATARQSLAEAEDRTLPAFRAHDTAAVLAGPWVDAAAGDQTAAVRRARATAARTDDAVVALFSLHDAVRLGAAEDAAEALERLAGDLGETALLARLFARHARACADDDGGALRGVAREFEVLGLTLYAAEAQARAARAFHRAGEYRNARAAAATGWALARRCDGARTPALTVLTAPELTSRQLEVARLAASGLSNRAIAERLTVSIRTVANHLCGAYERLGVNDRADLARLLAGPDRTVA